MAHFELKIKLMSDLCAASGQGFSSVIDTDVCYDEYGFPYVPARRLKGCLLEICKDIGIGDQGEIFGVSGNNTSGSLKLSNATIENYNEIKSELLNSKIQNTDILNLFTYTRAQTQIENEHAKDNSLRFTRVVKKQSPIADKPLEFIAKCEIGEKHVDDFSKICKALRNIGFNRTRGLGAIVCELVKDKGKEKEIQSVHIADDDNYECLVVLHNNSPLIISTTNNSKTVDYIPGTNILGNIAWKYIKKHEEDEKFKDLFLKENVIFSNFYLSNKMGDKFSPIAVCYKKLKKQGDIINVFSFELPLNDTPKVLKNTYLSDTGDIKKVNTHITYHHSNGDVKGDEILYTQNVISAGNYFSGTICGKGVYIKEILKLIAKGDKVRVGKSKTAQYSECEVKKIEPRIMKNKEQRIKADTKIAIVLESDLLLLKKANYSISISDLYDEIIESVGVKADFDKEKTSCSFKTITGYSGIWNMQKPHIKAFSAGSVIVLKIKEETLIKNSNIYIGEKLNEGFGKCKVYNIDEMLDIKPESIVEDTKDNFKYFIPYHDLLLENERIESIRKDALDFSKEHEIKNTASFVGRITLMLSQSANYTEFASKIESIKSESEKKKIKKIIDKSQEDKYVNWKEQQLFLSILLKLYKYRLKNQEGDLKDEL